MDTHYREIKPILAPGVTLATLGVLMTTIITGLFIYSLSDLLPGNFQLGLLESMLLAAVMSSTDSASVFSILRSKGISLKERLRPTLELESGSNDPMAYMLTVSYTHLRAHETGRNLVCRLLLEKKKTNKTKKKKNK